jgi:Ca-activated chloride channel family protein
MLRGRKHPFHLRAGWPESPALVYLPVSVREPRSRVVTGLDKSEFRLFEDGVEQEIAQLHTGDAAVSVGLVVDAGSTIGAVFALVDDSVRQAVRPANPADEFFVVSFDQEAITGSVILMPCEA